MASRVRVVPHPSGIAAINRRVNQTGDSVANAVARDARNNAPVQTGQLRSSIRKTASGDLKWRIWVGTDHWNVMEYGTKKRNYLIQPKLKKALWWPGIAHPVSQVTHPGVEPRPFMRPALYKRRWIVFPPGSSVAVVVDA